MTIKEHVVNRTIDLSMSEGNVFFLMGIVNRLAKTLDKDGSSIIKEMMSHDYGNAVYVFNREFGSFYDIILPKNLSLKDINDSYLRANLDQEKIEVVYSK